MVTVGPREKAIYCQTMAPLVKGLEGKDLIVELKNDIVIFGCLDFVDCFMNLTMTDVLMTRKDGKKYHFEFFFLQRKNLRYIRIPNNISIPRLLKTQVDIATGKTAREARRKAVEKRANWLKKKSQKNMEKGDLAPIVVETTALHQQEDTPSTTKM
ncbi:U7 snRNA-associated Sm-like protein LSm10 [Orchesella cincta]|uniref:U7 snRNA-associated Sm-like protein LSm10 n=1 Tax=Orchesella cincta TaxID=48709 RepID=A0A1D2NE42_ORCCI|nr:U7 snRNA-associated Sm-like protein LSm10 [Orchesella cincta]